MPHQKRIEYTDNTPPSKNVNKQLLNLQLLEANKQLTHTLDKIHFTEDKLYIQNTIIELDQIRLRNIK